MKKAVELMDICITVILLLVLPLFKDLIIWVIEYSFEYIIYGILACYLFSLLLKLQLTKLLLISLSFERLSTFGEWAFILSTYLLYGPIGVIVAGLVGYAIFSWLPHPVGISTAVAYLVITTWLVQLGMELKQIANYK